jgi:hypothetical protein
MGEDAGRRLPHDRDGTVLAESPKDEVVLSPDTENVQGVNWRLASSLAVQAQMILCPGVRTPRRRTRASRRPRQASSVHSDSLHLHEQAEQGRQTASGLRRLRALKIAGT